MAAYGQNEVAGNALSECFGRITLNRGVGNDRTSDWAVGGGGDLQPEGSNYRNLEGLSTADPGERCYLLTVTDGHDGQIQRCLQARWRIQPILHGRQGGGEDGGLSEQIEQP